MTDQHPPEPVAKAVYFIDGDATANAYQSWVIEFSGERWLVATWLQDRSLGTRFPERLVPLRAIPHVVQDDGLIRLGQLIPTELFAPDASPELLRRYAVATYPAIAHIQAPKSSH